jgi:BON domain-containing protein
VGVRAQDGTVWLSGTVANPGQMALAIETAQRTPGVERVVNNLTIGRTTNAQSDNRALRQPGVVPASASMELPEHAQQQLSLGGPMPSMEDEGPVVRPVQQPRGGYDAPATLNTASSRANMAPAQMAPSQMAPAMARPMSQQAPLPIAAMNAGPYNRQASMQNVPPGEMVGAPQPMPAAAPMGPGGPAPAHFDHPQMPGYAWPSYASYPNYAAVTYPKQYSPTAWPYIGPFYPYPQVPLGWRKVTLEWEDGWWFLDFKDSH